MTHEKQVTTTKPNNYRHTSSHINVTFVPAHAGISGVAPEVAVVIGVTAVVLRSE